MVSFLPMHLEGKQPRSEREETDESLRIEREAADHALEDELAAVAETADAVISRARARADSVLAATRAKTDQQSATAASSAQPRKTLERERVLEDRKYSRFPVVGAGALASDRDLRGPACAGG
jgi:hypothetical protein